MPQNTYYKLAWGRAKQAENDSKHDPLVRVACGSLACADVDPCNIQADVKVQNMVTLGASALNNNSAAYASYAILVDQAIGQQVGNPGSYLPSILGFNQDITLLCLTLCARAHAAVSCCISWCSPGLVGKVGWCQEALE